MIGLEGFALRLIGPLAAAAFFISPALGAKIPDLKNTLNQATQTLVKKPDIGTIGGGGSGGGSVCGQCGIKLLDVQSACVGSSAARLSPTHPLNSQLKQLDTQYAGTVSQRSQLAGDVTQAKTQLKSIDTELEPKRQRLNDAMTGLSKSEQAAKAIAERLATITDADARAKASEEYAVAMDAVSAWQKEFQTRQQEFDEVNQRRNAQQSTVMQLDGQLRTTEDALVPYQTGVATLQSAAKSIADAAGCT